jgi:5-methylcytosine-specific restriction endonuclease McrA
MLPRLREDSIGRPFINWQCPACGFKRDGAAGFKAVGVPLEELDPFDYEAQAAAKQRVYDYRREAKRIKLEARTKLYHLYLHSPFWTGKRLRCLRLADGRCSECGKPATQAHHLTYVRCDPLNDVFEEIDDDLQALCRYCHEAKHPDKAGRQQ